MNHQTETSSLSGELRRLLPAQSLFIDGAFIDGSGDSFELHYPATGEIVTSIRWASEADLEKAVVHARRGFEVWRKTPPAERARVLNRAAAILRKRNREIAMLETLDTGKPLQETLVVDVVSGADSLEYFAAQAATMTGEYVGFSGSEGDWGYTRREPLGICGLIGAWNYPLQIACWKSAPALACGNAVIFKPAELTPHTALELARALQEAGLPDGVFNVVQGDGRIGAALVSHPEIAKVSLTGETATGVRILQDAAPGLKKVTLELGGKSPLIVFDDADIDAAVGGTMLANFYSTGQVCSNGTRVFVQDDVLKPFVERLVARTRALVIGDPMDEATQIGPLVSAEHHARVTGYVEAGRSQARLIHGGGRPAIAGFEGGYWVEPTIFEVFDESVPIACEEIFGPVASLLSFSGEDEVVRRANATGYGLSAGVYTQDLARAHRVISRLEAGTCWINAYNVTPVELPFGGYKRSGMGRENGKWALDAYSQVKSVYVAMNDPEYPY
ncbi:MAG: betaine-aldehyde dehydrogenase [Pseudomonadota bacterium]|nr:betaine-aldehyde dehydrogenase [Pseudomonadota bacterium]